MSLDRWPITCVGQDANFWLSAKALLSEKVKHFQTCAQNCAQLTHKTYVFTLTTEQNFTEFELNLPYVILQSIPEVLCDIKLC